MKLTMLTILTEGRISKKNSKGRMVAFYLPTSLGKKLKKLGEPFKGEASKLKDMHITLGLVRDEDNKRRKDIENCLKLASQYIDPFEIKIDRLDVFPPSESSENMQVLHAIPESDAFQKIHELVFQIFEKFDVKIDNGNFEFKPHITIKYCSPEQQINTDKLKVHDETTIDEISFCNRGKIKSYKLGSN